MILFIPFIVMITISCETVISNITFDYERKAVAGLSLEEGGEVTEAYISRSHSKLSKEGSEAITDANVLLFVNDNLMGMGNFKNFLINQYNNNPIDTINIYEVHHSPSYTPGDRLRFEVYLPSGESALSEIIVPKFAANFQVVKLGESSILDEFGELIETEIFEISFDDPAGEENFYSLESEDYYGCETYTADASLLENQTSTFVTNGNKVQICDKEIYFSDRYFDGGRAKIVLEQLKELSPSSRFNMVHMMSKGEYEYSFGIHIRKTTGGDFGAQPVVVPSNMKEGLGHFGYRKMKELTYP